MTEEPMLILTGWIALPMLKRGVHDVPVFRTAEIAHQHSGEDKVHQVNVNLTGVTNINTTKGE